MILLIYVAYNNEINSLIYFVLDLLKRSEISHPGEEVVCHVWDSVSFCPGRIQENPLDCQQLLYSAGEVAGFSVLAVDQ